MTGDKAQAEKKPAIDPLGDVQPNSASEKVLNGMSSGHGCSAIAKFMKDVPLEERGNVLSQAFHAYSPAYTWQGKDVNLPAVSISADAKVPFKGKFGDFQHMQFTAEPENVNVVRRDNPKTGKTQEVIYRESLDLKNGKVDDIYCKDQ